MGSASNKAWIRKSDAAERSSTWFVQGFRETATCEYVGSRTTHTLKEEQNHLHRPIYNNLDQMAKDNQGTNPMSLKYSCSRALLAVILLLGSKQSILDRRSIPAELRPGTISCRFFAGHLGKADLKSGKAVTPGHVSSFGVPKILHSRKRSNLDYLRYVCLNFDQQDFI